ncbi:ABC transporter ATP-binding protein [Jiella endophytica]|uniref:ABC transporter ATP-binding protein n=1 Tax=Jiella endophytica TaxID=2558362 RepID=A0A4Y8RAG7_9HYPH|nr:ABC transporter ATP-binding protein [Jiella endophytica]TFF17859.1 ABC transporter ATP-binding protein [Jiella endophytica]
MSADSLLRVRDLAVHFPAGHRNGRRLFVHAVDGVSFDVKRGTTFGIVGESGSGKSTTAQAVMRLVEITAGEIELGGVPLSKLKDEALRSERSRFQMIFQDPFSSLDPRRRAGAAVRQTLDLLGVGDLKRRDETVAEMLTAVGLHPSAARLYPHQFSGGQRQRLCIARALASQPELVVCDEPVSALDVAIQAQILNLLRRLQREQFLTYLFISHDLAVVQNICDEVAVMYLGEFVEKAPTDAIFGGARHPYTWSLMAAALSPEPREGRRPDRFIVAGEPPSPIDPPAGCRFSGRCPFATERCHREKPALRELAPGHQVACHYAETLDCPIPALRQAA